MNFVRTSDGGFVRFDCIREVKPKDRASVILILETGHERAASQHDWADAAWLAEHRVIPAAAGTLLLHHVQGYDRPWIIRQPVIAWGVGPSGFVDPITSNGRYTREDSCPAILNPDGTVEDALGHYESYAEWLTLGFVEDPLE